ncbi:MAG: amino acid permease [Alicyclobacillus sp.]|nr:amino acid permease [Alicyclobacillus sp.]
MNSVFANAVAGQTSVVRNIFSLGREGILPRALGRADRRGVPVNAIIFDFVLAMVLGGAVGAWKGPQVVWNMFGGIMALCLIVVYGIVSLSLVMFYKRKHPDDYSPIRHLAIPIVGLLMLLLPLYGNIWPIPAMPYALDPYLVIAWITIGAVYLWRMTKERKDIVNSFGSVFNEELAAKEILEGRSTSFMN